MLIPIKRLITSSWHKELYIKGLYLSYILFGLAFTGISAISPSYLNLLETIIKYYVCAFLLLRFNPWISKQIKYTRETAEFDRRVAFSAGMFLLLTTTLTDVTLDYIHKLKLR